MTTYNGEMFLKEQINSILNQLNEKDELLISDDGSTDKTLDIIKLVKCEDSRIKLFKGPGKGIIKNFEYIIKKCQNEIILLCDQDDIWMSNKIAKVKEVFISNLEISVVMHDAKIIDKNSKILFESLFDKEKIKHGVLNNIIHSGYYGCCMCVRKKFIDEILPFPENILSHDLWISLVAEYLKVTQFLNVPLIYYRRHDKNNSQKLAVIDKFRSRWILSNNLFLYSKYKR